MSINKVIIMGTVTENIMPTMAGATQVAKFNICNKRKYKNFKTQEDVTETNYIDVEAWGKVAESIKSLKKGTEVIVEGRLKINKFKDAMGQDKRSSIVSAESVSEVEIIPAERIPISTTIKRKMEVFENEPFEDNLPF